MRNFISLSLAFLLCTTLVEGKSSLLGSPQSLWKQNDHADSDGLPQIKNDKELRALISRGILIHIPGTVHIDPRLEEKWRYCLPVVSYFLGDIGLEFRDEFGKRMQLNSAVRTIVRQIEITPHNVNAAPISGPRRTPHITGATVDITKIGLSRTEIEWIRAKLLYYENLGVIEATEEMLQPVFHIMVFNTYGVTIETNELRAQ